MKTMYIECAMGAAGDMLTAALSELIPDQDEFIKKMNGLNIPGVKVAKESVSKCGILGTHITVTVDGVEEGDEHHDHHGDHHEHHHEHHHTSLHDVEHIVGDLNVSDKVKKDILAVYKLIAEAESHAHNMPVNEIHFHEVGNMDAIADVTGVCLLMEMLSPEKVVVSPIHVGTGQVKCAHGILPVPAPATAYILKDCPIYGGEIKGELCTPTGAALLKYFADEFGPMPAMRVDNIGYGAGKKDFKSANILRIMTGETSSEVKVKVVKLEFNVDDMTAEEIGFATDVFLKEGAKEVFTVPVGMKKNRPGVLVTILVSVFDEEKMVKLIFKHTSTIGVRKEEVYRYTLTRRTEEIDTPYGKVRKKISEGYGVVKEKIEYDDIYDIAVKNNMSISEVRAKAEEN